MRMWIISPLSTSCGGLHAAHCILSDMTLKAKHLAKVVFSHGCLNSCADSFPGTKRIRGDKILHFFRLILEGPKRH